MWGRLRNKMVKVRESETGNEELFQSVRGFLVFGRLIGLIPYQGVFFSRSSANLKFRWISFPCLISLVIIFVLTFNCIMECINSSSASKKNAHEIAQSVRNALYYIWGTFVYVYFIARSESFIRIFQDWKSTSIFYTKPDTTLKRDVIIISVVILVSGTLQNALLYWEYMRDFIDFFKGKITDPNSIIEAYYLRSHPTWAKLLSYNPFIAVIAFLQHKCILFSWNCVDIWIALLGRALYFKFKALCEVCEEKLSPAPQKPGVSESEGSDPQRWIQMTKDHNVICNLMQTIEDFLSPLVFLSYAVNIYYLCMQLLDGLTIQAEKHDLAIAIYAPWSFIHLIMRIYVVSICCARINIYAHNIERVIRKCPSHCYNTDISRLDKRVVGARDIGLTGQQAFTVTKPFILSFIGFVFTFEMVLLQVVPDQEFDIKKNCCCTNA